MTCRRPPCGRPGRRYRLPEAVARHPLGPAAAGGFRAVGLLVCADPGCPRPHVYCGACGADAAAFLADRPFVEQVRSWTARHGCPAAAP